MTASFVALQVPAGKIVSLAQIIRFSPGRIGNYLKTQAGSVSLFRRVRPT
jgi:hypothetical protein